MTTKKITFQSNEARTIGLFMNEAARQKQCTAWAGEDHAKLVLLCQHYGIAEGLDMYYQLALTLSRKLYPEPKKRGRKSKWTALNKGALVVEVERLARPDDPAHGVDWACKQLAKREPWQSFLEIKEGNTLSPDSAEALRQIYYDFRNNKWAAVSRDAFKYNDHTDTLDKWEKHVADCVKKP